MLVLVVLNYILVGCPCRDYQEQIQQAVRARLELGASKLQVQRLNRSATLLPFQELLYRV